MMDIRKLLIGFGSAILALIILLAVYWASSSGRLEITLSSNSIGQKTYRLVSHSSGEEISLETNETSRSFKLKSGGYDVYVGTGSDTYFSVANVPGWFGKVTINASLQPEFGREFIGNNTENCPVIVDEILLSYPCGGSVSSLKVQVPATKSRPPYTLANSNPELFDPGDDVVDSEPAASIEGTFVSGDTTYAVISLTGNGLSESGHYIYTLTNNQKQAVSRRPVKQLDRLNPANSYSILTSGEGFIAYSSNFNHVVYYESIDSEGSEITGYNTENSGFGFIKASGRNGILVALFSNAFDTQAKPKSEMSIGVNNKIIKTKFNKAYSSVTVCGNNLVCLVDTSGLDVYQINNDKLELNYRMSSVREIYSLGDRTYLLTNDGVLSFDLSTKQGFVIYRQKNYQVESLTKTSGKLVAIVRDGSSAKYAINLMEGSPNDEIDSKLTVLKINPDIDGVVIYKNIIHVTPKLGEMVYDSSSHSFTYTREQRDIGDQKSLQAIKDVGIDTSKYQVVNLTRL